LNLKLQLEMKKHKIFDIRMPILTFGILGFFLVGCKSYSSGQYTYQPPENINDGIEVGTLNEVDIDTSIISKAVNEIQRGRFREVHSILIFKDNRLVFEEYFKGHKYKWDGPSHHGELVTWDRDMLHGIKSDTKSITSICIGIAIEKGFIESVHQSIFDYLPEHQHLKVDGKDKITIEHLLTMTSGLEWNEWGAPLSSSANDIVGLWFPPCDDPITCVLERPLVNAPGTSFTYSGGGIIILGEIIKNAAKMNIDEFSKKHLFEPLGIDSASWALRFENGVIEAAGSLEITPRDMVKIGVTFLNKGVWNGKQIISELWVNKSAVSFPVNQRIKIPGTDSGRNGYSYTWWTKNPGEKTQMFYAGGWGGQYIMVFPELKAVVVFTGGTYVSKVRMFTILEKYVLPALE